MRCKQDVGWHVLSPTKLGVSMMDSSPGATPPTHKLSRCFFSASFFPTHIALHSVPKHTADPRNTVRCAEAFSSRPKSRFTSGCKDLESHKAASRKFQG